MVVFVSLFVTIDYMSNFIHVDAPLRAISEYYLYWIPDIFHQMAPVGCLMAVVFTLGSLSKTSELTALFACGMSLARITLPCLVLVLITSTISFFISDRIGPHFNQKKNYVHYVEIRKQPGLYSTVKTNRIWYRSGQSIYNIKTLQPDNLVAQGLTMYQFDPQWHLVEMITAGTVRLLGKKWELDTGTVTLFPQPSGAPMTQPFKKKTIVVTEDSKDLQESGRASETLSLQELERFIKKNKEAGLNTVRYEVDYHSKISFGFAALVMSLLGIPFSVSSQRSGSMAFSIGITIGLAFLYWTFYSSGLTLARHGTVPPILGAWVPNSVMASLASFFVMRLKK